VVRRGRSGRSVCSVGVGCCARRGGRTPGPSGGGGSARQPVADRHGAGPRPAAPGRADGPSGDRVDRARGCRRLRGAHRRPCSAAPQSAPSAGLASAARECPVSQTRLHPAARVPPTASSCRHTPKSRRDRRQGAANASPGGLVEGPSSATAGSDQTPWSSAMPLIGWSVCERPRARSTHAGDPRKRTARPLRCAVRNAAG